MWDVKLTVFSKYHNEKIDIELSDIARFFRNIEDIMLAIASINGGEEFELINVESNCDTYGVFDRATTIHDIRELLYTVIGKLLMEAPLGSTSLAVLDVYLKKYGFKGDSYMLFCNDLTRYVNTNSWRVVLTPNEHAAINKHDAIDVLSASNSSISLLALIQNGREYPEVLPKLKEINYDPLTLLKQGWYRQLLVAASIDDGFKNTVDYITDTSGVTNERQLAALDWARRWKRFSLEDKASNRRNIDPHPDEAEFESFLLSKLSKRFSATYDYIDSTLRFLLWFTEATSRMLTWFIIDKEKLYSLIINELDLVESGKLETPYGYYEYAYLEGR